MASITDWDIVAFLGPAYHNYVYLPAQSTRGGILIAWREGGYTVDQWRVDPHFVAIKLREGDQPAWWFTGVYGPHLDADKPAMIYSVEDKNNDNLNRALMGRFRRFVSELDLKEIQAWQTLYLVKCTGSSYFG